GRRARAGREAPARRRRTIHAGGEVSGATASFPRVRSVQRSAVISSLVATAGLAERTHILPASAAIDEPAVGREVFAQLREDGALLFASPFYEHLNEIGSVIAETVRSRYSYPIRYYIVRGD